MNMLTKNWRDAWKWFSVQGAALIVAWSLTPADTQAALLSLFGWTEGQVTAALGVLTLLGRLIDQGKKPEP